jgi:streptogramin lyase
MKAQFGQFKWAGAAAAAFRHQLHSQLSLGLAMLAIFAGTVAAQTTQRSFPIRQGSQPFAITMGADGNYWFTLPNDSEVARITPRGVITYFTTPSQSSPQFITLGSDGNIWFTEGANGKIASITPAGVVKEHQFSVSGVSVGITSGSDSNIWFTDQGDGAVWRYGLGRGTFTEYLLLTSNSAPGDITTAANGNMWFTEQGTSMLGRITSRGLVTEFPMADAPISVASGSDGNIWVASAFSPKITRVISETFGTNELTDFPTPNQPTIIRPGNGNNLLFTEFSANKIGSITVMGVVTESPEFVRSSPTGITAGVGDDVWFLGSSSDRVYETVVPR